MSCKRGRSSPIRDLTPSEPFNLKKLNMPPPPEQNKLQPLQPGCICNRKVGWIMCVKCGYFNETGRIRVRRTCRVHPKVVFTSDLTCCPNCRQEMLDESVISIT